MWRLERDLRSGRGPRRAFVTARRPSARVIAQQPLVTVEPSLPLREAGELMLANGVSHLVVIEPGTERPIGILSTADVAVVLGWGEA